MSLSKSAFDFLEAAASKPSARTSFETVATAASLEAEDYSEEPYWLDSDWVPTMKSGKQRSPNAIRNELQKYIDNSSQTQTAIVSRMGVNNNSFGRFMNPGNYKDQWSAVQNGTYWAAARLLEEERNKPKSSSTKKRKADSTSSAAATNKKSKSEAKVEALALLNRIASFQAAGATIISDSIVFDSCPDLVKKIKALLTMDGITKSDFCKALGIQSVQLNKFLAAKKQDAAGTETYEQAWVFFEKKRLMENAPKSKQRLKNEVEHPQGFALRKDSGKRWCIAGRW